MWGEPSPQADFFSFFFFFILLEKSYLPTQWKFKGIFVFIYTIKTNVSVKIYVIGMQTLIKTDCSFYNTL